MKEEQRAAEKSFLTGKDVLSLARVEINQWDRLVTVDLIGSSYRMIGGDIQMISPITCQVLLYQPFSKQFLGEIPVVFWRHIMLIF